MKRLFFLLVFFALQIAARAQNLRYDAPFPSVSSQTSTPFLVANIPPNSPKLAVCSSPANATPCTNYVTTYTSAGASCPNGAQDTPQPQPSACQATGDAQGNIGFWAPAGKYDYTVCVSTNCYGPFTVTLSANGAGTVNGASVPGVGLPARFLFVVGEAAGFSQVGSVNAVHCTGSQTGIQPTATETAGVQEAGNGSASTNVVAGCTQNEGAGLNSSGFTFGNIARYTARFKNNQTTNSRFWVGLGDLNALADLSTATYASNAPPRFYCAFRLAAGTDTTWKAICATDATHQTIVDTGIVPTTASSTLFEIVPNAAMTSVGFFLNGTGVATITTNLPTNAQRPCPIWTGDDENTANVVSGILYWTQTLYAQ
jgi:hypothetical protein